METSKMAGVPLADRQWDWSRVIGIGFMHVGCLLAPFFFTWGSLGITALLWFLCGCLGITVCYHRLLTHGSFATPKWFKYVLTIFGTLNWQGGPIRWVSVHRLHHIESDAPNDPHSPYHGGFFWAHILWTLKKSTLEDEQMAKDLQRDPVMLWLDRYFYVFMFPLALGLYLAGGLPWLVWGIFVRTTVGYHVTWAVNSASHLWGYRNFKTTDKSRNNSLVAIFSFGEGWHNNHHAYQRSAAHGLRWWEFDLSYLVIRIFALCGLASKVVLPTHEIPSLAGKNWVKPDNHQAKPEPNSDRHLGFWKRLRQLFAVSS